MVTKFSRTFIVLLVLLPATVTAQTTELSKWWTVGVPIVAAAGPMFDGATTWWAMEQSGPHADAMEGNPFFHTVFGDDVKPLEIFAFKAGQAALTAAATHYLLKTGKKKRIASALIANVVTHATIGTMNIKNGRKVRRLNLQGSMSW